MDRLNLVQFLTVNIYIKIIQCEDSDLVVIKQIYVLDIVHNAAVHECYIY